MLEIIRFPCPHRYYPLLPATSCRTHPRSTRCSKRGRRLRLRSEDGIRERALVPRRRLASPVCMSEEQIERVARISAVKRHRRASDHRKGRERGARRALALIFGSRLSASTRPLISARLLRAYTSLFLPLNYPLSVVAERTRMPNADSRLFATLTLINLSSPVRLPSLFRQLMQRG
ncbi:hypothetical protein AB1N83_011875 [Pleurotus pulmonarius]